MFRRNKMPEELLALPFDQFSRQLYTSDIIEIIRKISHKKHLSILDVGGYKGKTQEFQSKDNVTVADLFDVDEPNYIKVGPEALPFEDNEFDVTVSFDTFEHVPRSNRANFLKEAVRVSSTFHLLAAPVDNELRDVNKAEVKANTSYLNMKGEEHRWLKEHIDYLIPTKREIEASFDELGLSYVSIQTNELSLWLQLHQFFFCAELHSECFSQVKMINTFFNKNMKTLEANVDHKVAYRSIYCLTKDKELFEEFSKVFALMKQDIYSPTNQGDQTEMHLEINRLVHEGYMLLASAKQ